MPTWVAFVLGMAAGQTLMAAAYWLGMTVAAVSQR